MADIITLGELLIDLTQNGTDENGNGKFTAFPGGAPANVAVAASRLGAETAFIGKVGNDAFGRFLRDTLEKDGVDTIGLEECDEHPTTMAIVSVDESGEREFTFYRDPGADTQLTAEEAAGSLQAQFFEGIIVEDIDSYEFKPQDIKILGPEKAPLILHIGSLSLTTSPAREACIKTIEIAKEKGMLISYDPNYREALWADKETAIEMMRSLVPFSDFIKVADEELEMLTGSNDLEEGSSILVEMARSENLADPDGAFLVMVTLGGDGVFIRCGDFTKRIPGFNVKVADTNGAGDTFMGAMLAQIVSHIRKSEADNTFGVVCYSMPYEPICVERMLAFGDNDDNIGMIDEKTVTWFSEKDLTDMVRYANRAASITCSRSGAIPAMPTAAEVEAAENADR